jgi:hypothetical protein
MSGSNGVIGDWWLVPSQRQAGGTWLHAPERRVLGASHTGSLLVGFISGVMLAFAIGCLVVARVVGACLGPAP